MNRRVTATSLTSFIIVAMAAAFGIQYLRAAEPAKIYIRADGSIDPPTSPITTADNIVYTFTADIINKSLVVERDNIQIDGKWFTLQGSGEPRGIDLSGRSNVTIMNMQIKAFTHNIFLNSSSNNHILGSNITNSYWSGIEIINSSSNLISGNIVTKNLFGIYATNSSSNNITSNNIIDNTDGVVFYFSSGTISENNITDNNHAILLDQSTSILITGNNVTNNGNGIYLFFAYGNIMHHNSFVNNTVHVYINAAGYANIWDDGYPSGGNYWSNYVDEDFYHGPYQNETGSDEIWDHPYIINADNKDNYPVVPEFSPLLVAPLFLASTALAAIIRIKRVRRLAKPGRISRN